MLSSEHFSTTRVAALGLTGVICLVYAALALAEGRPDPMPFWIPGVAGLLSTAIIAAAAMGAGRANARRATDEGHRADDHRAQRLGFWAGLAMYPLFALPLAQDWIDWPVAYAAMGTLTAAVYLLGFAWFDLRGRM